MKKVLGSILGSACLVVAAYGSANVFDDAVFWFRGGKDVNSDGYLDGDEFFDDLQANVPDHANHTWTIAGYKENATFVTDKVVFPALGTNYAKNVQFLRFSNVTKNGQTYPRVLSPYGIFQRNGISNKYTIIARVRLESNSSRADRIFTIGYHSTKPGVIVGFDTPQLGCKPVMVYRKPDESHNYASVSFKDTSSGLWAPINSWVDIGIVVGDGKIRIALAVPMETSVVVSGKTVNLNTIAFAEADMWTEGNVSTTESNYVLFGSDVSQGNSNGFIGSVQQIAIWGRKLSDQELMAAFGMPRPAIFRVGLANGASSEFGRTETGDQTIDGLASWRDVSNQMAPSDTWTVNFGAMRDEAGLPQVFSMHTLPGSAAAAIAVSLNGTSLGTRRVHSGTRVFWPVPENIVRSGENTLTIHRNGSGNLLLDSMELGGSSGVGIANTTRTTSEGMVEASSVMYGCVSTASANPDHWPYNLATYTVKTNNLAFWVDPDLKDHVSFDLSTSVKCIDRGGDYVRTGTESFRLYVNGVEKWWFADALNDNFTQKKISFAPGELLSGWNSIKISTEDSNTCYWGFDYYRFKATLSRGFSIPPPGAVIYIR